jgi:hypothetical protein
MNITTSAHVVPQARFYVWPDDYLEIRILVVEDEARRGFVHPCEHVIDTLVGGTHFIVSVLYFDSIFINDFCQYVVLEKYILYVYTKWLVAFSEL